VCGGAADEGEQVGGGNAAGPGGPKERAIGFHEGDEGVGLGCGQGLIGGIEVG
jgi:hypothetical protein